MCEFCSLFPTEGDRDTHHSDFAGFFSAAAIDAAVRQAHANSQQQTPSEDEDVEDDKDDDGT